MRAKYTSVTVFQSDEGEPAKLQVTFHKDGARYSRVNLAHFTTKRQMKAVVLRIYKYDDQEQLPELDTNFFPLAGNSEQLKALADDEGKDFILRDTKNEVDYKIHKLQFLVACPFFGPVLQDNFRHTKSIWLPERDFSERTMQFFINFLYLQYFATEPSLISAYEYLQLYVLADFFGIEHLANFCLKGAEVQCIKGIINPKSHSLDLQISYLLEMIDILSTIGKKSHAKKYFWLRSLHPHPYRIRTYIN